MSGSNFTEGVEKTCPPCCARRRKPSAFRVNNINFLLNDSNYAYTEFQDIFKAVVDRHAPLKTKVIRGNQAPFMNRELAKSIMTRSRLKNNFVRHKTKSNWITYKKQRNKCTKLRDKSIKNYFSKKTEKGSMSNSFLENHKTIPK